MDNYNIETTSEGFLLHYSQWDQNTANYMANNAGIELTAEHWEIIDFIREYYIKYEHLPNSRMFVAAIRKKYGVEKGNSRYLQNLFPAGPLKYACKIAGLPKPPTCL